LRGGRRTGGRNVGARLRIRRGRRALGTGRRQDLRVDGRAAGPARPSLGRPRRAHDEQQYDLGVEDREPRRVEKPWGYELWWADTDAYAGKLLHVEAGHRLSLQLHREKDETSYVLSGRLRLTRGPTADDLEEREIGPGHAWRVTPGTVHSIEAIEDS